VKLYFVSSIFLHVFTLYCFQLIICSIFDKYNLKGPFNCNAEGIGGAGLRRGYNRAALIEVARPLQIAEPSNVLCSGSVSVEPTIFENGDSKLNDIEDQLFEGTSTLQLGPTRCHASWARLESIPPPAHEVQADTIRPSAEYPCLPAEMLAHHRNLCAEGAEGVGQGGRSGIKLDWITKLIRKLLQEDITNKILILVETNAIVEGISMALEHDMLMGAATATSSALNVKHNFDSDDSDDNEAWSGKSFVRVDTTGSQGYRAKQISLFTDDPTIAVCVATRNIAGVGLNLTVANVVVLFDPAPTLGEEGQAVNRVLRLGQTRSVRIYRVYMKNSLEERLLCWRKLNGELDSNVMGSSSFTVQSTSGGDYGGDVASCSGKGKQMKGAHVLTVGQEEGAESVLKQWRGKFHI
jgi:hypothetical protein